MSNRLPSLNSLRIFEAVARLLSYTAAAEELQVTTSAISHRIKALEQQLGTTLIDRRSQRIALTPIGKQYAAHIAESLAIVASATHTLLRAKGAHTLKISSSPMLASRWLLPRLNHFMSEFPDIHVELSAVNNAEHFTKVAFDVGLRYLRTIPTGLHSAPLGRNHIFPICNPSLTKGPHALRIPADLKNHTLIEARGMLIESRGVIDDEEIQGTWRGWLQAAGHPKLKAKSELFLSPRWLMVHQAIQGGGVGLGRGLPISDDLAHKRLIIPFGPAIPLTTNFHMVCKEDSANNPEISLFRDWVVAEAEKSMKTIKLPLMN